MGLKQKAAKGVVWSVIQNWGGQAVSLIVFFILARLLGPTEFGLVALANVFLAFMQVFLSEGFAKALIQRETIEPAHLDTVFWLNLAVSLVLFGTTLAAADNIAGLFQEPELAPILRGFSILFVIASFSTVQQTVLEREFAFKAIAMRSLVGILLSGLVGIAMALAGFGVWSLVGQQIVYELVAAIVLWRLSDWRPGLQVSLRHLQDLWSFGINIFGFNVLTFFHTRADDLLIGYFLDATALGYYSLAYRILTIMTDLLVNAMNQVALPTFARLQHHLAHLRAAYFQATQLTSLMAFPMFLGVAVLANELILILFGAQWLSSVLVLQLLSIAGVMRSVTFFKSSVLMAMDKSHWRLRLGVIDTTLNTVAFVIAVHWGIYAVALAYVVRFYVMFPVGQWVVGMLIDAPLVAYLRQLAMPLLSAVLMAAAMVATKAIVGPTAAPVAVLLICSIVGSLVYATAIVCFAPNLLKKAQELTRLALERP
jgi:O-antigen/teichoic acid export membrane protein